MKEIKKEEFNFKSLKKVLSYHLESFGKIKEWTDLANWL